MLNWSGGLEEFTCLLGNTYLKKVCEKKFHFFIRDKARTLEYLICRKST